MDDMIRTLAHGSGEAVEEGAKISRIEEPPPKPGGGGGDQSAVDRTEVAVVSWGGEEELGERAGGGIGWGEAGALFAGWIELAVETQSHVNWAMGTGGGEEEEEDFSFLRFLYPLVFLPFPSQLEA